MHDGKKLPRWKPRSHRTMNMGLSANHSSTVPLVLNLATGYINSQFHIVFDDWFATVAASAEALPDFNSPEWADMFGDSTFYFNFDDDEEDSAGVVEPNPDLPEALARSHQAVSQAMEHHRPATPLPVLPPVESSVPVRRQAPLRVMTDVFTDSSSVSRESLLTSPRESLSTPPREHLSTPPREHSVPSSSVAYRQQREETVLTPATTPVPISSPNPTISSSLRRSSRSNLGQGVNRLVDGKSDTVNLSKGPSNRLVNLAADEMRSAERDLVRDIAVRNKIARDARPETCELKNHLVTLLHTSRLLNYPQHITDMYDRALGDLDHSDYIALDQPDVYPKDSRFNKGAPEKTWLDPKLWSEANPGVSPQKQAMVHAFLVAAQPHLSHIYADNGITQPYAFKASNSDPDTLSYAIKRWRMLIGTNGLSQRSERYCRWKMKSLGMK